MGNRQSNTIHLELDASSQAVYPGAQVFGKLHIDIVQECRLEELKIKVNGYEIVDWIEDKKRKRKRGEKAISLRDLTVVDR